MDYSIVFTKADKLSNNERYKQMKEIKKKLNLEKENHFFYSSLTREGRENLVKFVLEKSKGSEEEHGNG
ncbi:MAG: GTP-binding protein YsxC [bacterium ADurb.Bin363]|nr:MAG: GTP-binding protein YsxC [bacterium ADurb.Bin363]